MQLTKGTLLHGGTYKIERTLGQGSFGITYLATHTSLDRKVAIKEFFMKELNSRGDDGSITGMSDGSLSYNYGQKFKKEALNLSRLDHPNIVRVTDSFDENGTYYYVMDYIEGENLNDYLKHTSVSQKDAIDIITSVAKALQYMHDTKHMLHLDLKPGNIMRRASDGHIFLIDFGLSKHFSNSGQPETSTTIGLGTPGYAPIEQSNQAKNGEFRPTIDVYALGATLFKLLTRETPPPASDIVSDDELIEGKLRANGITGNIIDVVVNAMLPNVKKRTQTVSAFLWMLTATPVAGSTSTSSKAKVQDEETLIAGTSTTKGEETIISPTTTKHPNFDESKYVIPAEYKNYPTTTGTKANSGDIEAMLALGMMALRGEGVLQSTDTAYAWFQKLKNLGDDRGEKLLNDWYKLKEKYKLSEKVHSDSESQAEKTKTANDSYSGLWIIIGFIIIIVLCFCVKGCIEKREAEENARIEAAAAAKRARIESIVRNTEDWYGVENGGFYCMVEGTRHYVSTYGIPDGQRTVHYSSGATFVGTITEGKKTQGKFTYKNGDYFNGTFSNGTKDTGYGKETSEDGSYYEGNYKNGMRNGKGKECWPNEKRENWGCMFECTYKDGHRHGIGTWYYNNHNYEKVRYENGKEIKRNIEYGTWR